MKEFEGSLVIAYGQKVRITFVMQFENTYRIYLEHPIVVPTMEYTRDYISPNEIQNILIP